MWREPGWRTIQLLGESSGRGMLQVGGLLRPGGGFERSRSAAGRRAAEAWGVRAVAECCR